MHAQHAISAWLHPNRAICCGQKGPELPPYHIIETVSQVVQPFDPWAVGLPRASAKHGMGKVSFFLVSLMPVTFYPFDVFKYREVTSSGAGFCRLHLSVRGPCSSLCNVSFVCKKQLWSSVTQTLLNGETPPPSPPWEQLQEGRTPSKAKLP